MDSGAALSALSSLKNKKTVSEHDKKLAAVKISPVDLDLIMKEMNTDRATAEATLREADGIVLDALRSLVKA